jgi:hypothetical protein
MKKHYFVYFIFAIILIYMVVSNFWQIFPYTLIEIKNSPYPILNKDHIVYKGEVVKYLANWCRNTDKKSETEVFLVYQNPDLTVITLTEYLLAKLVSSYSAGCYTRVLDYIYIPNYIPDGTYFLRMTMTIQANPLRTVTYESRTEEFEIK